MSEINIGERAPEFSFKGEDGEITLSSLAGKNVILYFYPKDDTPGCTTEAKDFTDLLDEFEKKNTVVLGVSKDSLESHAKFKDKHGLKVILASDPDGEVIEEYGSWVQKTMFGKKYMGVQRDTFFIDDKGIVKKIWRKVKVGGHAEDVLESIH